MRPSLLILPVGTWLALSACGVDRRSPVEPTTVVAAGAASNLPISGEITGRVVSAAPSAEGVAFAAVEREPGSAVQADAAGFFRISATGATGLYPVTVSANGWISRRTLLRVPGPHAEVSLMSSSVNATHFDQMCRGIGGALLRWTQVPRLQIERSVITYGSRLATDEQVPAAVIDATVEKLRRVLPVLSAGRFADFASIDRVTTAVGAASSTPVGAITVTWQRGLLPGFGHVAYGARSTAGDVDLQRGEVAQDADWHIRHLPVGSRTDFDLVLQHELGHTLGYSHTALRPSFMYETYLQGISSLDLEMFSIFFQRPSGNTAPDKDPTSASINTLRASVASVDERLW